MSFTIKTERDRCRPHHLHAVLEGDLVGPAEATELQKLAAAIAAETSKTVIVDSDDCRISPEGVEQWISFAAGLPDSVQIVYAPSHLSMVLRYDKHYYAKHPDHVHVSPDE